MPHKARTAWQDARDEGDTWGKEAPGNSSLRTSGICWSGLRCSTHRLDATVKADRGKEDDNGRERVSGHNDTSARLPCC